MKEKLAGAGIGLLGGLIIGITDSEWIRLIIVFALIAFTGKSLKETLQHGDVSPGQSLVGIAAFLAVIIGLYINGQQLFKQSPSATVDKWVKAGFSPPEARAMYLKQWELENLQDNEPSAATQAMLKSFLDRIDSEEKSKSAEQTDNTSRPDSLQEEPALTDSGDEMPVETEIP
ncbi:MAG: hypothetical protein HGA37_09665 [Lentimicrobium sp.]|nr:hypothetical protein [Lentimicrobium sp.]